MQPAEGDQVRERNIGKFQRKAQGVESIATILEQAARERISVAIGGKTRMMSKLEAAAIQMANKAAAGDPKAVHMLLYWIMRTSEAVAAIDSVSARPDENDAKMMAQLIARLKRMDSGPA